MSVPAHAVLLDPDYRKMPDTTQPWCWRCQKRIKDTTKAVRVTVLNVMVWPDSKGHGWLGKDCAKIIGLKDNPHGK